MPDPHSPAIGSQLQLESLFAQLDRINDKLTNLHRDLVPATVACPYSLAELTAWWVDERCPARSRVLERNRLQKWILGAPIGEVKGQALCTAALDDWLFKLERQGTSPSTLNHLRSSLSRVFNQAIKAGKWLLANPVYPIAKRREPVPDRPTLTVEEVPLILHHVGDRWRDLFAAALMTGLRKGELFGLRKTDVDLERRVIYVGRSYDFDCTKGGHVDTIPFPDALAPYLVRALANSASELLFPGHDGNMQVGGDAKLCTVMRRTMVKAGILVGYDHACRRCLRQFRKGKLAEKPKPERYPDAELRHCQRCGMKLWPKAIPRRMTFHGTRHTAATVMLRAGASLHHVQRLLRHRDPRMTSGTYGHLLVEDLRPAVNLPWGKVAGLEPSTPASQAAPSPSTVEARADPLPPNLLKVRQVAARLRVSTATIYSLVESGDLPHCRVLNSIRVEPADLQEFLLRHRKCIPAGAVPLWRRHRRATVGAQADMVPPGPAVQ